MNDRPDQWGEKQFTFGLEETHPDAKVVSPTEVRAELLEILAVAQAATKVAPWDRRTHRYHKVVFPQMAHWLPDEEAEQLCFQFAKEMERIEALLAA